ncbi:MAG: hypothetical protein RLZZ116_2077, partial [Planctomycetota bacterium]
RLAAGERLVLATDGVGESKDEHGVEFGMERIIGSLRESRDAEGDVARLVKAVNAFAHGVRHDDLTVLSLARDG